MQKILDKKKRRRKECGAADRNILLQEIGITCRFCLRNGYGATREPDGCWAPVGTLCTGSGYPGSYETDAEAGSYPLYTDHPYDAL